MRQETFGESRYHPMTGGIGRGSSKADSMIYAVIEECNVVRMKLESVAVRTGADLAQVNSSGIGTFTRG
jgi:4-diphosphocytidyl-2C-methyl-D-erythritol kinase